MDKDTAHDNPGGPPSPPVWDLQPLFPSAQSPEFKQALVAVKKGSKDFFKSYHKKTEKLTGRQLAETVAAYEDLLAGAQRVRAYVTLLKAADRRQEDFAHDILEQIDEAVQQTAFFIQEIGDIGEEDLLRKMMSPELAPYGAWLGRVRAFGAYRLLEDAETYVAKRAPVAERAWEKMYEKTLEGLRFTLGDRELTLKEIIHEARHAPSAVERQSAYTELGKGLGKNKKTFSLILNTLIELKNADDARRGFDIPEDRSQYAAGLNSDMVEEMVFGMQKQHHAVSHRYYAWKAKKAGVTRLHPLDANAPPAPVGQKRYSWDQAKSIVLGALGSMSPELAAAGKAFFEQSRIDAEARPEKGDDPVTSYAGDLAFISLHFSGTPADVARLAREVGAGIRHVLSAPQGHLRSELPPAMAGLSGRFCEMLVVEDMLAQETDALVREDILTGQIEGAFDDSVQRIAMYLFEQAVHDARKNKGEVTPDRISRLWRDFQADYFGKAVDADAPGMEAMWMLTPQLIYTPFDGQAETVGECLSQILFHSYTQSKDKEVFAKKYEEFLKAGGTQSIEEAFAVFGLDIADPKLWAQSLAVTAGYVGTLVPKAPSVRPKKDFGAAAVKKTGQKKAPPKGLRP